MFAVRRAPFALALVGALVLTACSSDPSTETTTSPSPTPTTASPTPTSAPTSTSSPSPTGTATGEGDDTGDAGVPAMAAECQLDGAGTAATRVTFAFPRGWQVAEDDCRHFDPALAQAPEGQATAAVTVRVLDEDFAAAAKTEDIEGEIRHVGARSGYQAVRIQGGSAGQAMDPDAEPVHVWLVDLDAGADEQGGGTLSLTARPSEGASFEQAATALDRMAQTIQVQPPALDDGPVVVTRTEGGGTPWTVTHDLDTGCFRLRPGGPTEEPVDEACDLDASGDGMAVAVLESGDLQVVAGHAPPLALLVSSSAATAPYGGVTTGVEGSALFAYEVGRTPIEVRAVDAGGETIATVEAG